MNKCVKEVSALVQALLDRGEPVSDIADALLHYTSLSVASLRLNKETVDAIFALARELVDEAAKKLPPLPGEPSANTPRGSA